MARRIQVNGKVPNGGPEDGCCLVDEKHWPMLDGKYIYWYSGGYVQIEVEGEVHYLHVYIMKTLLGKEVPKGHVVHHMDNKRYNNTEANLAVVSCQVNSQARVKASGCSSQYSGVCLTESGNWHVQIRRDKVIISLGTYTDQEEAGMAYDIAALAIHAEQAGTNGLLTEEERQKVLSNRDQYMPKVPAETARSLAFKAQVRHALDNPGPITRTPEGYPFVPVGDDRMIVDEESWAKVAAYTWNKDSNGYAQGHILIGDEWILVKAHRYLMGCQSFDGRIIDHIDHDKRNNRLDNLRVVTASQNARNKTKKANCSSQFRGVTWDKKACKWKARIRMAKGKRKHLGYFDMEEEASKAYEAKYAELEAAQS